MAKAHPRDSLDASVSDRLAAKHAAKHAAQGMAKAPVPSGSARRLRWDQARANITYEAATLAATMQRDDVKAAVETANRILAFDGDAILVLYGQCHSRCSCNEKDCHHRTIVIRGR